MMVRRQDWVMQILALLIAVSIALFLRTDKGDVRVSCAITASAAALILVVRIRNRSGSRKK